MGKLRVGIFSFTCDEGCSIVFLEVLNRTFFKWKGKMDIVHSRILRSKNEMKDIDVALVEGAISTRKEEQRLREIRANSKKVVAIGSCAIDGSPANIRNFFDAQRTAEIQPVLRKFKYAKKVSPLSEYVKVDDTVPGCPMDEEKFIALIEKLLDK
jgi:sulfhydrogenase subunit delta